MIPDGTGILVVSSLDLSTNQTAPFPEMPVAGEIITGSLINYPADASTKLWLKQQLSSASGGKFWFDDAY